MMLPSRICKHNKCGRCNRVGRVARIGRAHNYRVIRIRDRICSRNVNLSSHTFNVIRRRRSHRNCRNELKERRQRQRGAVVTVFSLEAAPTIFFVWDIVCVARLLINVLCISPTLVIFHIFHHNFFLLKSYESE